MAKKSDEASGAKLSGKIVSFNISPKGHREGVVLETARGLVQVNFPKHGAEDAGAALREGAKFEAMATLQNDDEAHPVYNALNDEAEVRGVIASLNYSRHGEVNGYQLEDGTFVHTKPDGAKKHKGVRGQPLRASGSLRHGKHAAVLEATTVHKTPTRSGRARSAPTATA